MPQLHFDCVIRSGMKVRITANASYAPAYHDNPPEGEINITSAEFIGHPLSNHIKLTEANIAEITEIAWKHFHGGSCEEFFNA